MMDQDGDPSAILSPKTNHARSLVDGSVLLPEVLQPYMGGLDKLRA